jgi:hypothetical protein
MQPSNPYISTIILLVFLLIVTNLKAIIIYLEWLQFKIKTFFKHLENDYNNNSTD